MIHHAQLPVIPTAAPDESIGHIHHNESISTGFDFQRIGASPKSQRDSEVVLALQFSNVVYMAHTDVSVLFWYTYPRLSPDIFLTEACVACHHLLLIHVIFVL